MNVLAEETWSATRRCLVVDKAARELVVFKDGRRVAAYPVSLGVDPVSDKRKVHDFATPEGLYFISYKKDPSQYHRTLGLSYPSLADAEKALAGGVISVSEYAKIVDASRRSRPGPCGTGLGCAIAIHGGGVFRQFGSHLERDWTEGCVALDNADMDRLFAFCRQGDRVVIFNSAANLFGLARPFSRATVFDVQGLPLCPQGVCAYEAEFATTLGRMVVRITEGRLWSVQVTVHATGNPDDILLTLFDRNADGRMSFQDSAEGPLAQGRSADKTCSMVRQAVVDALSGGTCLAP
ncbi:L,D-transpeptidase [Desulfomicrobium sp. ZS1]|uniref:L,D-transpeptidase family protein n=1 Tax=Desulfomicrobium sp. ZS1 TaxID=2952228 RepID=UPI0020B3DB8D|nr:L,D-transpeptidase [Desulfomicrobium sp. ZS1]UTF48838.1 L,D-transpeptidase [Desulfomicrobium sp. ZS1]